MEEPQQVIYRYEVQFGDEVQIPWHQKSRVLHSALLATAPGSISFWVSHPSEDGHLLPFFREFYSVGTTESFPAKDVVEGVVVAEFPSGNRLVAHLIRREPRHTYN